MIEHSGDTRFDYRLHDGSAPARIQWHFFERSQLPVAVQTWELPPGGSEGAHAHPPEDPLEELYLVIEGTAVMHLDGERFELGPGDALLAPVGSEHDLHNPGHTPLKVVVIWGKPATMDWSGYGTAKAARAARARGGLR